MDDLQRYREIRENADPEDPTTKLRLDMTVAFDQALAAAIRLERQGKTGKVRALGFTETADELAVSTEDLTPGPELYAAAEKAMSEAFRGYTGTKPGENMWNLDMEKTWWVVAKRATDLAYRAGREDAARDIEAWSRGETQAWPPPSSLNECVEQAIAAARGQQPSEDVTA